MSGNLVIAQMLVDSAREHFRRDHDKEAIGILAASMEALISEIRELRIEVGK